MKLRPGFQRAVDQVHAAAPDAVRDAARPVASAIASEAPKATGRLADSVAIKDGSASDTSASVSVEVSGGHEPRHFVAAVEYGSAHHAANPFIRRAFRRARAAALARIASGIARALRR